MNPADDTKPPGHPHDRAEPGKPGDRSTGHPAKDGKPHEEKPDEGIRPEDLTSENDGGSQG